MPSPQGRCHQPHLLRFLFTGRLYIKCFSFRIGSFNMFYRKPFYVPIKNHAIIEDDEKQRGPRNHCLFRKSGFASPVNDMTVSFPVHYGIRRRGSLKKKNCRAFQSAEHTCVCLWARGDGTQKLATLSGSTNLIP